MIEGPEVIGNPPSLNGVVCEDFIVAECWVDGALVSPANVIYLRFGEQWYHLCLDIATIFWSLHDRPPERSSDQEENIDCPLIDIGEQYHLKGAVLESYEMACIPDGAMVRFLFADGTCVLIKSVDDYQTWEIAAKP
ncbi:MAG: hypothetical protein JSS86_24380 [Cyanobacteria bacterium SZAS LIN-2]|nr:hypothetical protein [Cyanobacteria bacterium SZAS LIN-2]